MNKIDFTNYKFRCSSLGKLMVNPRAKKDLLSKTTEAYLREIYIEEVFERRIDIRSKYLEKGLLCEEDSISLLSRVEDKLYMKNDQKFENDWICGTPDVITPDEVIDMKTSWSIHSFMESDGTNKDYYWQLQGYMNLLDKSESRLVYALVNAPDHLIAAEKSRKMFQDALVDGTEAFDKMEYEVERNMMFDDIPEEIRIKAFSFKSDPNAIEKLKVRITDCRKYLNSLNGLS